MRFRLWLLKLSMLSFPLGFPAALWPTGGQVERHTPGKGLQSLLDTSTGSPVHSPVTQPFSRVHDLGQGPQLSLWSLMQGTTSSTIHRDPDCGASAASGLQHWPKTKASVYQGPKLPFTPGAQRHNLFIGAGLQLFNEHLSKAYCVLDAKKNGATFYKDYL